MLFFSKSGLVTPLMKLKEPQIQKLAFSILQKLTEKRLIQPQTSSQNILKKIVEVIFADLTTEERIEKEAKKMMDQYRTQVESGQIDYQKMYVMIKKELIKKYDFTI